jgi:hypothetical protein
MECPKPKTNSVLLKGLLPTFNRRAFKDSRGAMNDFRKPWSSNCCSIEMQREKALVRSAGALYVLLPSLHRCNDEVCCKASTSQAAHNSSSSGPPHMIYLIVLKVPGRNLGNKAELVRRRRRRRRQLAQKLAFPKPESPCHGQGNSFLRQMGDLGQAFLWLCNCGAILRSNTFVVVDDYFVFLNLNSVSQVCSRACGCGTIWPTFYDVTTSL